MYQLPFLAPTFALVAEKTECSGKEYSRGYMANAEQCAVACKGWSTLFVFGTNDFGTNRCNDEGHCRCYCETQALKDGTCSQIDHAGYRLYKFTGRDYLWLVVSRCVHLEYSFWLLPKFH